MINVELKFHIVEFIDNESKYRECCERSTPKRKLHIVEFVDTGTIPMKASAGGGREGKTLVITACSESRSG